MTRYVLSLLFGVILLVGCTAQRFTSWSDHGAMYFLDEEGGIEFYSSPNMQPPQKWVGRWTPMSNAVVRADVNLYRAQRRGEDINWQYLTNEIWYIWLDPMPPPCMRFQDPVLAVRYGTYRRDFHTTDIGSLKETYLIMGEVLMPGRHKWRSGITLTKVISEAGGFLGPAYPKGVKITRGGTNLVFDVLSIQQGKSEDVEIQTQDIIFVPRRM